MCMECPVEVNEKVIRAFVIATNGRIAKANSDDELIALAMMIPVITASVGIELSASDPKEDEPATLTLTRANASLLYVLGPDGYQEANG